MNRLFHKSIIEINRTCGKSNNHEMSAVQYLPINICIYIYLYIQGDTINNNKLLMVLF